MSEALPARPNLQWYKKLAKKKLLELRKSQSSTKLSDAQLAIAREHGFSSWRKLKTYIESPRNKIDELLNAAGEGNLDLVRQLLDTQPSLINATGARGMTAMHAVVEAKSEPLKRGHLDVLRYLLKCKPDLE